MIVITMTAQELNREHMKQVVAAVFKAEDAIHGQAWLKENKDRYEDKRVLADTYLGMIADELLKHNDVKEGGTEA